MPTEICGLFRTTLHDMLILTQRRQLIILIRVLPSSSTTSFCYHILCKFLGMSLITLQGLIGEIIDIYSTTYPTKKKSPSPQNCLEDPVSKS